MKATKVLAQFILGIGAERFRGHKIAKLAPPTVSFIDGLGLHNYPMEAGVRQFETTTFEGTDGASG